VRRVFKDQVAALPDTPAKAAARSVAVNRLQQGVLSELTAVHARNVTGISLVSAVAATVSPGAARLLAANPAVAEVIPDVRIREVSRPAVKSARAAGFKPLPGACAPKGKVQLDPEAIDAAPRRAERRRRGAVVPRPVAHDRAARGGLRR
jgi:hypothetical protein